MSDFAPALYRLGGAMAEGSYRPNPLSLLLTERMLTGRPSDRQGKRSLWPWDPVVTAATEICAQRGKYKALMPGTGKLVFSEVITSVRSNLGQKTVTAESFRKRHGCCGRLRHILGRNQ